MSERQAQAIVDAGIPDVMTEDVFLDLYDKLSEIEINFPKFISRVTGMLNKLNRMATKFQF